MDEEGLPFTDDQGIQEERADDITGESFEGNEEGGMEGEETGVEEEMEGVEAAKGEDEEENEGAHEEGAEEEEFQGDDTIEDETMDGEHQEEESSSALETTGEEQKEQEMPVIQQDDTSGSMPTVDDLQPEDILKNDAAAVLEQTEPVVQDQETENPKEAGTLPDSILNSTPTEDEVTAGIEAALKQHEQEQLATIQDETVTKESVGSMETEPAPVVAPTPPVAVSEPTSTEVPLQPPMIVEGLPDLTDTLSVEPSQKDNSQQPDIVALAASAVAEFKGDEAEMDVKMETDELKMELEEAAKQTIQTELTQESAERVAQELAEALSNGPAENLKSSMIVVPNGEVPLNKVKNDPDVAADQLPLLDADENLSQDIKAVFPAVGKTEPSDADDLATLATAALTCDQAPNDIKEDIKKEPMWYDVGFFRGTSCLVNSYYEPAYQSDQDHNLITSDNLPDFLNAFKIELEPGTAYKFRVCAVNSCGRGPWSEVSAFKTCLPGYPGAPSSIKISKSADGAHLSWEPPSNPAGNIIEYSVCLAVRNNSTAPTDQKSHMAFVKVYSGPHNQTVVPNSSLTAAHIDTTSKPAIIFRIAARNEKGFGPATQVRWLQDVVASPGGGLKAVLKKEAPSPNIPAKRPKLEDHLSHSQTLHQY